MRTHRLLHLALLAAALCGGPLLGGRPVHGAQADSATVSAPRARYQQLRAALAARQRAATPYLVIDTRANVVLLRDRDHTVLRAAKAATGAPRRLENPKSYGRDWWFATPSGRFRVLRKVADPLWTKPAWHFVETGEEAPVFAEDPRRFARGILGSYAIYFLKDIMIHGTLYEINLGKSITHGCVRVGEEDLAFFYENVQTGWPVFAF